MFRRTATGALLAVALTGALALSACSSPATTATNATSEISEGGTLTVALDRELPTLDVTNGLLAQQPVLILSNALYQPLMAPAAGGTFTPGLAKSLESDETATHWTLTIPDDVTFSDGSPLTTAAVKAHVERLANPESKSSAAGQAKQIAGMTITDDTTMVFDLAAPNADFASLLARTLGMITSTTATDELGFPLGAGPFVIDAFTPGDSVTVVRNENYWGEPAALDSITFKMMPDADSRYQSLQSGDVDLIWTEVTSQFEQARADDSLEVHAAPAAVSSLLLNLSNPKFEDVEIRTALAQAIDRDAVNAVVNLGEGITVDSPYSLLGDLAPTVDYPEYDVEAAKDVLEGAGLSFTIASDNSPDSIQRATAIKDMLGEAGVEVEIEPVEGASFSSTLAAKDFEAAQLVTSIFSDPSGGALVATSTGPYNFTGYANDEVDQFLKEASGMTGGTERSTLLADASEQLATDLPMLWLTASNAGLIGSADLAGFPDLTGITLISVQPAQIGWAAE
ncbi:peptide/nickel transport system substrate-binding protein [Glaciihabitans tibetensis]|uniref:Peptide/nickel transport system substrate-binding protein n=1 Tax=Glaciihabitans tibetensis TaxID=1266600 RepID=A0A2T0V2M1_9MICO|nr:ABC transporter substrate-binding protein [Glaciihabitans tibetensis]PRY64308.1 peptide/nickel transport system substrate-binding protein [Glaciihabitans tibetensis]